MACSLKLSNHLFIPHISLKNKLSSRFLIYGRQFCSKSKETNDQNHQSEDNVSKENTTKLDKEFPEKSKIVRDAKAQFSDETKAAAKQKLMSLLSEITVSSDSPTKKASNLNLARPIKRISKKERLEIMKEQEITPEKEMDMALKAVASSFKDDPEKIKSELKEKLSSLKSSIEDPQIDNEMSENLMSSVKGVAETIAERPIPPRSELTQRLLRMSLEQKESPEKKKSMRSVIEKMKLETKSSASTKKSDAFERKTQAPRPQMINKIDIFGSTPLNIFKLDSGAASTGTGNMFWQKLQEKQVRLLTQYAPANAFEEMIMWTEQGKHWTFPIDNEIEVGAEENVGFNEHVFLDHHLEGFPTRGPIRHFMELVVVGLSKNPYISAERKVENIEWFRNYFKEKEDILVETGALE